MSLPRFIVLYAFFMNGALFATWVSRIPYIQDRLSLSEGALGVILMGMSIGVLSALSVAGGIIARFGSRLVTTTGAIVMCIVVASIAWAPHPVVLWIMLFVFGASLSTMDVAMNAQAVLVEKEEDRPLMSSFHASFSIGGLVGAVVGSGMEFWAVSPPVHFASAAILLSGGIFLFKWLLYDNAGAHSGSRVFQIPPKVLWPLGAVAFCTALGEGTMADWSAVYLTKAIQSDASIAALGFAAFSLTMTFGRLIGDWLKGVLDPVVIVRWGGIMATVGLLASVLTSNYIVVLIGFACVGLGLANCMPLAFSAAGNQTGIPAGTSIAGVASIGYAGFLAGPPFVGLIAEELSLRIALLIIAALVGSLVFTAGAVKYSTSNSSK